MLSVYYKIWVDAISVTRASKSEGKSWKLFTIIPISFLQGINLVTILLWVKSLDHRFTVVLPVNLLNVGPVNVAISLLLTFFIPFVILNYLLILYNNRYKMLMETYKPRNGKRYLWYIAITLGVFALPHVLGWIF